MKMPIALIAFAFTATARAVASRVARLRPRAAAAGIARTRFIMHKIDLTLRAAFAAEPQLDTLVCNAGSFFDVPFLGMTRTSEYPWNHHV